VLYYLIEKSDRHDIAESIISMAGMKLNEDSGFVRAFTEAYTRIVIYPSRSIAKISDPEVLAQEQRRSREINMAATRQMIRQKHSGRMILLFPSGTRYRPGVPETKRGVKESTSYIKSFDTMVFVAIAGNVLHVDPDGDMTKDLLAKDVMVYNVSEPVSCDEYHETLRSRVPEGEDTKQFIADQVMLDLDPLHDEAERLRQASGER
jgi:glycerol-3-phosphate O-acyltransferase